MLHRLMTQPQNVTIFHCRNSKGAKKQRNILLGQKIKVCTDHKTPTYNSFNTERVMRWRLILKELSSELIYIKGFKYIG